MTDPRIADFLDTLAAAPARALLLDYDGTLAPFRVERDRATPYEGVREALRRIIDRGRTRVVVISGRTLDELRPLLGVEPPPELWGTHGWERLEPGGAPSLRTLPLPATAALADAARAVDTPELAERIEVKPAAVAVHVRGLPDGDAARVLARARAAWEPLAAGAALVVHAFDGGLELRVSGWDKGDAVRSVLDGQPHGTAVAYLGDDTTDEDAFRALATLGEGGRVRGIGVLVRAKPRPSAAQARITPPDELLAFLDRWGAAAG